MLTGKANIEEVVFDKYNHLSNKYFKVSQVMASPIRIVKVVFNILFKHTINWTLEGSLEANVNPKVKKQKG